MVRMTLHLPRWTPTAQATATLFLLSLVSRHSRRHYRYLRLLRYAAAVLPWQRVLVCFCGLLICCVPIPQQRAGRLRHRHLYCPSRAVCSAERGLVYGCSSVAVALPARRASPPAC